MDQSIEEVESKISRLNRLLEQSEQELQLLPFLGLLVLLAIPVGLFFGVIFALLTIGLVAVLVCVAYYIVGVHRSEYAEELNDARAYLRELRDAKPNEPSPLATLKHSP